MSWKEAWNNIVDSHFDELECDSSDKGEYILSLEDRFILHQLGIVW